MASSTNDLQSGGAKPDALAAPYGQNKHLGLHIIRNHDPDVSSLIALTTFTSVYEFHDSSSRWGRANIEGFLFLVKRKAPPLYRLIVLNQKHQQNLVENIDASWELTEEPHYIFYRRDDPDVYRGTVTRGLWFHDDAEGHRIRGHLKKMIAEMKELAAAEKRTATKGGSAAESSSANGGDSGDELTESMVAELLRSIIASK